MAGNILFEGSEYAEALDTLRKILQEQRYEDFYNGIHILLQGRDADRPEPRKYVIDNIVLPFVLSYIIGRKLHGDKLIASWQEFFRESMSGKSWEENLLDSMAKGAEFFAETVKVIQKNIDDFMKRQS